MTNSALVQTNTVVMNIAEISNEKAVFQISNELSKPIFLFFQRPNEKNGIGEIYRYWLRCNDGSGVEKTYNQFESHIFPNLELLGPGENFRFEVSPLPRTTGDCRISVLYYDDPDVADIINHRLLDADPKEKELIEKSKKSVEIRFDLKGSSFTLSNNED